MSFHSEFCTVGDKMPSISVLDVTEPKKHMLSVIGVPPFIPSCNVSLKMNPGNDMLMDLFLEQFEKNKNLYECDMNRRVGKVLSCDHTFKTSKHIGVTRDGDQKFVRQFQNVFLGLNENGEVLT